MANPIKYNTSAETLALKKGNFYIGTGDVGKGPTSSTGYYNGITPPSSGYTVYLNKASDGPAIYTVTNDAGLISLTNSIAGTSYTTAAECLVYFAGQTDKVCVNRDYESIVTNGLVLNLDAGFTPSYSTSGTTWYDVSIGGNNASLYNTPSFSNTGFTNFTSNQYIEGTNNNWTDNIPTGTASRTIMAVFKTPSSFSAYNHIFHYGTSSSGGSYGLATVAPSYSNFPALSNHTWAGTAYANYQLSTSTTYIGAVRFNNNNSPKNNFFINGQFPSTLYGQGQTADYSINTGTTYKPRIGVRIENYVEPWGNQGYIYNVLVYNRYLSDDELTSNYNALKGRFGL